MTSTDQTLCEDALKALLNCAKYAGLTITTKVNPESLLGEESDPQFYIEVDGTFQLYATMVDQPMIGGTQKVLAWGVQTVVTTPGCYRTRNGDGWPDSHDPVDLFGPMTSRERKVRDEKGTHMVPFQTPTTLTEAVEELLVLIVRHNIAMGRKSAAIGCD